jgi:hypothetical protein
MLITTIRSPGNQNRGSGGQAIEKQLSDPSVGVVDIVSILLYLLQRSGACIRAVGRSSKRNLHAVQGVDLDPRVSYPVLIFCNP